MRYDDDANVGCSMDFLAVAYVLAGSRRIRFAIQSDAVTTSSDATCTEKVALRETSRVPLLVDANVVEDKEDIDFVCTACLS